MTDFDRVDKCSSMLQEAISEATGGGTAIQRDVSRHMHSKVLKRSFQFITTATGIAMPPAHTQQSITRDQRARLIDTLVIDQNLARHDPTTGFICAFKDAAFN
jgi:hypothetical protein